MSQNITNDNITKISEFGEKIANWQLWNYFEIKGFLCKPKTKRKWVAAFLAITLCSQKIEKLSGLPHTDSNRIVHEVYDIDRFPQFLNQLIHGSVTLGKTRVSLELMLMHFTHELQMRSYCQQEYGIDEACLLLVTGGKFSNELTEALKKFDSELQTLTDYTSTKSAIKQTLGIDFGTYAYQPFVRVLAPIDVKISRSEIKGNKITISLTASKKVNPKDVRVALEGYNQEGLTTGFSKNLRDFRRLENQEVFDPVSYDMSPYSLYVKVMLYYKDEIIEDFFLKNIDYASEELISKEVESAVENLKEKKQNIKDLYKKALQERKVFEKGRLLEQVISALIELVPKLKVVNSRVYDGIHEVDLHVRNFNREGVWADFEGMIFVECKNWSEPAGSSEIASFYVKLKDNGIKCGLFVSIYDITGKNYEDARGQVKLRLPEGYKIVILNGKDIEEILNCKDVSAKIDEKYIELYT